MTIDPNRLEDIMVEVGRRLIYGAEPLSEWMIGTALLSLVVNQFVVADGPELPRNSEHRLDTRVNLCWFLNTSA